jgi:hypothetical protein
MGTAPYVAPEMAGHFRHNTVFIGGSVSERSTKAKVHMAAKNNQNKVCPP